MPRRALRCIADVDLRAITCPGTWLTRREDVYVSVTLMGQTRRTQLSSPIFPLLFHECFRFDKVFYTAFEPSQVAEALEDYTVLIELIQMSEIYEGGRLLAFYEGTARDFMYPYPTYSPTYSTSDREVLLQRSLDFPGISPKLEFCTKTVIQETAVPALPLDEDDYLYSSRSRSPSRRSRSRSSSPDPSMAYRPPEPSVAWDTLEHDSLDHSGSNSLPFCVHCPHCSPEESHLAMMNPKKVTWDSPVSMQPPLSPITSTPRTSARSGKYRQPTISSIYRSRSVSPSIHRQLEALNIDDSVPYYEEDKPPFVVRKVDSQKLIGRTPGIRHGKSKRRSASPHRSYTTDSLGYFSDDYLGDYNYRPGSRISQVVREPGMPSYPVYSTVPRPLYTDSDIDSEVERLTSRYRTRPLSPLRYSSIRDRLDERPYSPTRSSLISDRVDRALSRNRSVENLHRLYDRINYYDSQTATLDELALDFERAKLRSMDRDGEEAESEDRAAYRQQRHRQLFTRALQQIYGDMYLRARTPQLF